MLNIIVYRGGKFIHFLTNRNCKKKLNWKYSCHVFNKLHFLGSYGKNMYDARKVGNIYGRRTGVMLFSILFHSSVNDGMLYILFY